MSMTSFADAGSHWPQHRHHLGRFGLGDFACAKLKLREIFWSALACEKYAQQYPQADIVDWNSISNGHPEYFAPDGVHLVPEGVNVYVSAILEVLKNR